MNGRRGPVVKLLVGVLAIVGYLLAMGRAEGAYPGANGKIAFETTRDGDLEIYSMNPDGSGLVNLTQDDAEDTDPVWSPDGSKIAFVKGSEGHRNIYVMNADGSGATNLTPGPETTGQANSGVQPTWSPDGRQIAYSHSGEIWVMNADGSGKHRLTDGTEPSWGVNNRIAFVRDGDIWVMNSDGSNQQQLTTHPVPSQSKRSPDWSPDGRRIVYTSGPGSAIWVMNANGSNQHVVATNGILPAWSPDGESIVFSSSSQQYGAPNGNDLFVVDADGGVPVRLPGAAVPQTDSDPNWQPANEPSPISTTTSTSTSTTTSSTTTTTTTTSSTSTTSTSTSTSTSSTTTTTAGPTTTTTVAGPTTTTTTPPNRPGACDNGRDDDGDGLVDFTLNAGQLFDDRLADRINLLVPGDPGCASPTDTSERNPTVECDDGVDNDGDGAVDTVHLGRSGQFLRSGGDEGCRLPTDVSERFDCDDGLDNDGDGLVDTRDPGCEARNDGDETAARSDGGPGRLPPECDDGVDNDGDGLVDFRPAGRGDPGCNDPADRSERAQGPGAGSLPCDDGLDNDGDGLVDFTLNAGQLLDDRFADRIHLLVPGDPGCASPTDTSERDPTVECDDGIDNDSDGAVDTVYMARATQLLRAGGDEGCRLPTDVSERFDCDDGLDNDGDGLVDTRDPGCDGRTDASETSDRTDRGPGRGTTECDDGVDNDNDGLVDFRPAGGGDPGCTNPADFSERAQGPGPSLPCEDGLDNDGDGLVDFTLNAGQLLDDRLGDRIHLLVPGDPGCASPTDTSERNPTVECDDGIDNDGDGAVDTVYMGRATQLLRAGGDEGCRLPTDVSERFDCDDGLDNDGDGLVDTRDPGCDGRFDASETAERTDRGPGRGTPTECDDGIDNDNDGLVDFRPAGRGDPGCTNPADRSERAEGPGPASLQQVLRASLLAIPNG